MRGLVIICQIAGGSTATSGALEGSYEYRSVADPADVAGSGGVARRTPDELLAKRGHASLLLGVAVALVALAAWLVVFPRAPDLAAQVYRVSLFRRFGLQLVDTHWYGGHELLGYSLLFPALGSALGLRLVACLSVLASTLLFVAIARELFSRSAASWGAACFALAAAGDVWSGRLTFALGVPFALGAVLAFMRGRTAAAVALAVLCAVASPVAGLLLALAGVSEALWRWRARGALVLGAPALLAAGMLAALFGDGGFEPFPARSFVATMLVVVVFALALPRGAQLLRVAALVFVAACVLCLVVRTPMGSNVERYAVLLAAPLLVCAVLDARGRMPALACAALALIGVWVLWGPVRETRAVAGSASTSAAYYAPVERFLAQHVQGPVRVEVPLTRSHWEAALLAPSVSLARGWEKQLEERYDGVLLASGLTAAAYDRWLHDQAVRYVALPDTALDPSSAREGVLIRRGLPFLSLVFQSAHWRIYAVGSPTPLAAGPGRLASLGSSRFALRASAPGRFVVRVRYSRYWAVERGSACVRRAPGGWTAVRARASGTIVVGARFSLARALGIGSGCG